MCVSVCIHQSVLCLKLIMMSQFTTANINNYYALYYALIGGDV